MDNNKQEPTSEPWNVWLENLGRLIAEAPSTSKMLCFSIVDPAVVAVGYRTELKLDADNPDYTWVGRFAVPGLQDEIDQLDAQDWSGWQAPVRHHPAYTDHARPGFSTRVAMLLERLERNLIRAIRELVPRIRSRIPHEWTMVCVALLKQSKPQVLCPIWWPESGPYLHVTGTYQRESWQKPVCIETLVWSDGVDLHLYFPRGEEFSFTPAEEIPCLMSLPLTQLERQEPVVDKARPRGALEICGRIGSQSSLRGTNRPTPHLSGTLSTQTLDDLARLLWEIHGQKKALPTQHPEPISSSASRLSDGEIADQVRETIAHIAESIVTVDFPAAGLGEIFISRSSTRVLFHPPQSLIGPRAASFHDCYIACKGMHQYTSWGEYVLLGTELLRGVASLPCCQRHRSGLLRLSIEGHGTIGTILSGDRPWIPFRSPLLTCTAYQLWLLMNNSATDEDAAEAKKSAEKMTVVRAYARLGVSKALEITRRAGGYPAEVLVPAEQAVKELQRDFLRQSAETQMRTLKRVEGIKKEIKYLPLIKVLLIDLVLGEIHDGLRQRIWQVLYYDLCYYHHEPLLYELDMVPAWTCFATRTLMNPQATALDIEVVIRCVQSAWDSQKPSISCPFPDFFLYPVATRNLIDAIVAYGPVAGMKVSYRKWTDTLIKLVVSLINHPCAPLSWAQDVWPILDEWQKNEAFDYSFREACRRPFPRFSPH